MSPVLWLLTLFLVLAPSAHAAPPEFMTYQGFLVDGNGNPLAPSTPANYPVIFRIFTAATGGTRLWSEQQIVTVDKGNFSVILGEGTPVSGEARPTLSSLLAGPNNATRYMSLSVTIGSTTSEMLPRLRLLPAPYSFTSTSANGLINPNGTSVVAYANNRVEVYGDLFTPGVISGNGSGLTGLSAAQIPALSAANLTSGTLADARLSANVALRSGGNTFAGTQVINGNVAFNAAGIPMNFGASTGDKLSLYGASGNHYGFGVQNGLLQIHTDLPASDVTFGSGASASMAETMRIKGNGNVGIGTNNPTAKLEVNGAVKIIGANTLEFGGGITAKDGAAGRIGYGTYTPNTLDIVGAGANNTIRKVKIFAEGGADFTGGIRARGGPPGSTGVNNNGYAFAGNGGDNDSGMFSSADGQVEFHSNGSERMRVVGPRVGINTTSPRVPLDVVGSISYTVNATQPQDLSIDVLDATGLNNGPSAVTKNITILAENHVAAVGFVASSDRRIKTGITTSPKEKDLAAIQQLRVAEYGMKDTIGHGATRRKGFIAQEVEQIIPQAVSRNVSFIPDIFALATNVSYTASAKALTLTLSKPHELKAGERLRLHLDSDRHDLTVARVLSPYAFVVEGCAQSPEKVFVYGREVNDFRTVDYDLIFTTSVGAIQELAAKVQCLESENKRLAQVEKATAEATLKHQGEMTALHRQMNDLKQMVQQLAAARTTPQNEAGRNVEGAAVGTDAQTSATR